MHVANKLRHSAPSTNGINMKLFTFYYETASGGTDKAKISASNHGIAKAIFKSLAPANFVKIKKIVKEKNENGKIKNEKNG